MKCTQCNQVCVLDLQNTKKSAMSPQTTPKQTIALTLINAYYDIQFEYYNV